MKLVHLPDRAVLELAGDDRVAFLQGLVSNDVAQAAPGRAVWAALLTAQGKYLADFFILTDGARLLLDCAAGQAEDLARRLARYRLRSRVTIAPSKLLVHVAWDGPPPHADIAAPDPRLKQAGWRLLHGEKLPETAGFAAWDRHRLALGLPDGLRDLEADKTVLLEAGFDELGGISWSKGCYMGQELTARTRYRGLLKRRLVPVRVAGTLPPPGTIVLRDGAEVGTLRSGQGELALATLRLDALEAGGLSADGVALTPLKPEWMRLPA